MTAPFIADFYPTPKELIAKMLEGIKLSEIAEVLDLGAGRGDIGEYINEARERGRGYYDYRRAGAIDVIEINPEFQHILRGKGFRLVHDDILTFRTHKVYDLIIGNLPFSIGAECLNNALNLIERSGGHLRVIVNAETIRNTFTNLRKSVVRRLEELGAEIEYLPGEFTSGERPTKVEGALIKLHVNRPDAPSIILDSLRKAREVEVEEEQPAALVGSDFVTALIARFNVECRAGIKLINEYFALLPHIADRIKREDEEHDYSRPLIKLEVEHGGTSKRSNINKYLEGVRQKYWALLLNDPRFNGLYTSNILNQLHAKLTELRDYDFTLFNIQALIEEMRGKIVEGIEKSILDLFDKLTRKFAYDESIQNGNVWFYSGWKSNKAHKVNGKVVLPMYLLEQGYDRLRFRFDTPNELRDMVKVFNYLNDDRADVRLLVSGACASAERREDFRGIDLRYFEISCFKKGTVHIKFTNKRLLDKFNIFAAQRRNWLPPAYGTKPYAEMDEEEREVINNFQGREAYEEIYKERKYYIVDNAVLLELANEGEQGGEMATVPMLAAAPAVEAETEEQTPTLVLVAQPAEPERDEEAEAEQTPTLIEVTAEHAPEQPQAERQAEPEEAGGEDGDQRRLFAA